jgi:hypothetical protein
MTNGEFWAVVTAMVVGTLVAFALNAKVEALEARVEALELERAQDEEGAQWLRQPSVPVLPAERRRGLVR